MTSSKHHVASSYIHVTSSYTNVTSSYNHVTSSYNHVTSRLVYLNCLSLRQATLIHLVSWFHTEPLPTNVFLSWELVSGRRVCFYCSSVKYTVIRREPGVVVQNSPSNRNNSLNNRNNSPSNINNSPNNSPSNKYNSPSSSYPGSIPSDWLLQICGHFYPLPGAGREGGWGLQISLC